MDAQLGGRLDCMNLKAAPCQGRRIAACAGADIEGFAWLRKQVQQWAIQVVEDDAFIGIDETVRLFAITLRSRNTSSLPHAVPPSRSFLS